MGTKIREHKVEIEININLFIVFDVEETAEREGRANRSEGQH